MGDAGSTFLGAIIAIALLDQPADPLRSWSTLVILLPIVADAIYTLMRRLQKRENIFKAHRSHLYQRLQQSGLTHQTVASIYTLVTIAIALLLFYYDYWGAIVGATTSVTLLIIGEIYLSKQTTSPI
jgi:UDP-N-acetylmuramyl pentapeptide phosphotransferase/UDP-N-acetylglucosamine-1-phosphate transferase